jgi:hypothetical protein
VDECNPLPPAISDIHFRNATTYTSALLYGRNSQLKAKLNYSLGYYSVKRWTQALSTRA